ncbi:PDDEXK-like family protein [Cupriavidus basilensis]
MKQPPIDIAHGGKTLLTEFGTMATQEQFERFLTDPHLSLAIEASRRVDDIFDLIRPNENQHSSILQWLLDPREGHGQGEAIFKDFLMAAHEANRESGGKQALLSRWTPGKIAITGFQSLIVIREKGMTSTRGRQDLFLVDPVHQFIILVENKVGMKWGEVQLKQYREGAKQLTNATGPFRGYEMAYVLLDRYKDEATIDKGEIAKWAYLDYMWLEKAARRAEARAERGLEAGQQLVMSYCRRQAEYKSPEEIDLDKLLAGLTRDHRDVVTALGNAHARRHPAKPERGVDSIESHIWLWSQQQKDLTIKLRSQKALAYVEHVIKGVAPDLQPDIDFVGMRQMFFADLSWAPLMSEEEDENGNIFWPLCIRVREMKVEYDDEDLADRKYSLCVEYRSACVRDEIVGERIREALSKKYQKNELTKYQEARRRRLGLVKHIPEDKIAIRAAELYKEIHGLIKPIL